MSKMKYFISILILIFLSISTKAQKEDAIILKNVESFDYNLHPKRGSKLELTKVIVLERDIQLNSSYAIDQFNKIYIPYFEENNTEQTILEFEAKTIKANGQELYLDTALMHESSLPANDPDFFGTSGKVKVAAFENLEVGDRIYYRYKVQYDIEKYTNAVEDEISRSIRGEYPVLYSEYSFNCDQDLKISARTMNMDQNFTINKRNHRIIVRDVPPLADEKYTDSKIEHPYIKVKFDTKRSEYNSWGQYMYSNLPSPNAFADFIGTYPIREIAKDVKNINSDQYKMVEDLRTILNDYYEVNKDEIYEDNSYTLNLYSIGATMKLIEVMNLNASIVLVRRDQYGEFNDFNYNFEEFDNFLLEFKDREGKYHYWDIMRPYNEIDKISFEYYETKALRIFEDGSRKKEPKTIILPKLKKDTRTCEQEINVIIQEDEDQINYGVHIYCTYTGLFEPLIGENTESSYEKKALNYLTEVFEAQALEQYEHCEIDTIYLKLHKEIAQLDVVVDLTFYEEKNKSKISQIRPQLFIFENDVLWLGKERRTDASIGSPFIQNIDLNFIIPEGYTFNNNQFLNQKTENDYASIESYCEMQIDELEIRINYNLKESNIPVDNWSMVYEVNSLFYNILLQRLFINK
jgi:hypothetical protein